VAEEEGAAEASGQGVFQPGAWPEGSAGLREG